MAPFTDVCRRWAMRGGAASRRCQAPGMDQPSTETTPAVRLLVLALGLVLAAPGDARANPSDNHRCAGTATEAERQAVTETVKLYFQGHATGNGDDFRRAFHADAKLFWAPATTPSARSCAAFLSRCRSAAETRRGCAASASRQFGGVAIRATIRPPSEPRSMSWVAGW